MALAAPGETLSGSSTRASTLRIRLGSFAPFTLSPPGSGSTSFFLLAFAAFSLAPGFFFTLPAGLILFAAFTLAGFVALAIHAAS